MRASPAKPRRFMAPEDFVRAWNEAANFDAFFALYPGGSRNAAMVRASELRRQGVPLKRFSRPRRPSIADLSAIARKALRGAK